MLKKLIIVVVAGFAIAAISTFFRLPPVWMRCSCGSNSYNSDMGAVLHGQAVARVILPYYLQSSLLFRTLRSVQVATINHPRETVLLSYAGRISLKTHKTLCHFKFQPSVH